MENNLPTQQMPRLGDTAPSFTALTTEGIINFPEDYHGRWKILFSHPADFTSVCSTEFVAFARWQEKFEELGCQLIGVSIDSISSHNAWIHTINNRIDYHGRVEVRFPLVADITMKVSRLYGMLQPNASTTAAARTVFFIDPMDKVRAVINYPAQLGRNFEELYRVLMGLQTIDAFEVALPADWEPGSDVISPAPATPREISKRAEKPAKDEKCYEWFLCTKPLPREKIEEKLMHKFKNMFGN
ncbi:MAG: peroxiredoxin [Tidjanibacter sp.]|nr:peroxiredoxin [Tidjanibacter sp.]